MRVGLLGCGNVGAAVVRMLHDHAEEITRRSRARIEVVRVGVRDVARPRDVPTDPAAFTDDLRSIVADPAVDVVVELLVGTEPARGPILAAFARGLPVAAGDVYREGIRSVTAEDIAYARGLGYAVKLLAIGESSGGEASVRVYPAMIPAEHPLASVRDNFNAVFLEGEKV